MNSINSARLPQRGKDLIGKFLNQKTYQEIPPGEVAKMLGYFTSQMAIEGRPWRLYSETAPIGELEGLKRILAGKPVEFRPFISRQMEVTSDTLDSLSPAGALGSGNDAPSLVSDTVQNPGFLGMEGPDGKPVVVKNSADLKLLYQLYCPDASLDGQDEVSESLKSLATFSQARGTHSWRFYNQATKPTGSQLAWELGKGASAGLVLGAALGGVLGAPIAMWTESWLPFIGLTAAGAAWFGQQRGREALSSAAKGETLNVMETLTRVLDREPVVVQKTQLRSVGLPMLGKFTWYTDYQGGSEVTGSGDLKLLSEIQTGPADPTSQDKHNHLTS